LTVAWVYALAVLALVAAYPLLALVGRLVVYRLVALTSIAMVLVGARMHATDSRLPRWVILLALGLTFATAGLMVALFSGGIANAAGEVLDAVGNVFVLAAAISLVVSRGRANFGGVVDTAIIGLAFAGLLWNFILLPIEQGSHVPTLTEVRAFVVIFALAGVLGALVRLGQVSKKSASALWIFAAGLVFAIVGNAVLDLANHPWLRTLSGMMFMMAYASVGLLALSSTAYQLAAPGTGEREHLTDRRLLFLGIAVAVVPVALGMSAIFGGHVNGTLLVLGGGLVTALVMIRIRKLSAERQAAEEALGHLASHDALTGLVNRREFEMRLENEQTKEQNKALLFCDLDGFKQVNDRYGHRAGDELLIQTAKRLVASVRESDVVARLGGDEFLILLKDVQQNDVDSVLGRISAELRAPVTVDGHPVRINLSIGVVDFRQPEEIENLIKRADEAMYRVKQTGPKDRSVRARSSDS
jgi:diguanylate cyclase (GGDEF)-like protein